MDTYNETEITSSDLLADGVLNTFLGPILVEDGQAVQDFDKTAIDKNFGNRSIQSSNPRTGVGMISANHFIFIVVATEEKIITAKA